MRKYAYYFSLAQIKGFIFTDLAIKMERKRFTESKQIEFPSGLSKNNIVGIKQCCDGKKDGRNLIYCIAVLFCR